ncbi:Protein kinase-like (PK-like) [Apiospora aurea]|uniref:Protein kinase-like (PK-like) n=1 Tax=Apiospora aurea TaxID=335848 RepID=A0ABR1QDE0_9PEZI
MHTKHIGLSYYVAALRIGGPPWPSIHDKTPELRKSYFTDHSASGMVTPDISSLQLLSRFANPFRWSCVAREIAGKKLQPATKLPHTSLQHFFPKRFVNTLISTWRLTPASLRILIYRCLGFIGAKVYGSSCSLKVQQLPFGMYLKTAGLTWHEGLANEYGALRLIRQHTHMPVPCPIDLVSDSDKSYLLTSRVSGVRLGSCIDTLSEDEERLLVYDLQRCIEQLRAIPKDALSKYAISNAVDEACYDHRVNMCLDYDEDRGDFVGPFVNEEQFNKTLQTPALPDVFHCSGHKIVFTHSDLNMRNVLVRNGRLSGIVD